MKKLITFAIPCYNSSEYMHNCIESLIGVGEDVEIIIINDGSRDNTGEIADKYQEQYPDLIKVIHQENGGHGEGVNQGLINASGKYYKVVDSDDRLNKDALKTLLIRMREHENSGIETDMYICNYVYDHWDGSRKKVMKYSNIFPKEEFVTWDETKPFGLTQYLMMHSVIYRTQLLRDCKIVLPKHTFYVDNLYMYQPFPHVNRIYYMDLDLYMYFIGRADQSVNEQNVIKRIDQQLLVTRLMFDCHDLNKIKQQSKKLYRYMIHEMALMVCISSIFLYKSKNVENYEKADKLWEYIKNKDIRTYRKLRYCTMCALMILGKKFSVMVYSVVRKVFRFN